MSEDMDVLMLRRSNSELEERVRRLEGLIATLIDERHSIGLGLGEYIDHMGKHHHVGYKCEESTCRTAREMFR